MTNLQLLKKELARQHIFLYLRSYGFDLNLKLDDNSIENYVVKDLIHCLIFEAAKREEPIEAGFFPDYYDRVFDQQDRYFATYAIIGSLKPRMFIKKEKEETSAFYYNFIKATKIIDNVPNIINGSILHYGFGDLLKCIRLALELMQQEYKKDFTHIWSMVSNCLSRLRLIDPSSLKPITLSNTLNPNYHNNYPPEGVVMGIRHTSKGITTYPLTPKEVFKNDDDEYYAAIL